MKNTITFIIFALFFTNCKAQVPQAIVNINTYNQDDNSNKYFKDLDNNYTNFTGTWENTTGNITFRLFLWKETKVSLTNEHNSSMDNINGSYKIIQNAGTLDEIVLHNSVKYYPQNNKTSDNVIYAFSGNSIVVSGSILDTCSNNNNGILDGFFRLTITNFGSSPSIANWKIQNRPLYQGQSFTVPTDIILTKVN